MAKTISVINQKGGVGKTTTAVNLSAALGALGKKVLLVDIDPQGNSTSGYGINKRGIEASTYDMLINGTKASEVLINTKFKNVDILPSDMNLAGAEVEVVEYDDRNFILRKALESVRDKYDFILIDCPPSLNTLTCNALTASDSIIIPLQCEFLALEGLKQLLDTIEIIRERTNEKLAVDGVLFTMYDNRTNLSAQVVENVYKNLSQRIYQTVIPRAVRLAEAPSYGMPITFYDKRSQAAQAYRDFAVEVLRQNKKKLVKRKKLLRK